MQFISNFSKQGDILHSLQQFIITLTKSEGVDEVLRSCEL